ncbi:MAG: UDP-N-acetyl-D-glucosamine dehydrogenase, partial [Gemmatimonadetes bacterium]|nr:UDP-N-acetyl-D-glucosamine dehydrogenase [Gemmatimonadota bacterium]
FRAVNIGLVNEMAVISDRLGIDVWEVVDAAATKPYGFMRFFPGPGLGGHCIPIDPLFLAWKMKTLQYRTRFIELAAEVNAEMPLYVIRRAAEALNSVRKSVNGSRVLVLGVAYKPDVNDTRESPALDVIALLRQRGAEVEYHDPFVPGLGLESGDLMSVELTAGRLDDTDLVIVATDHTDVDYELVGRHASLVVDPRNAMKDTEAEKAVVYPIAGPPRNGRTIVPRRTQHD